MINHLCKNILVSRREIYISALYSVSFQNASKQTIKERKMEENQAALEMDLATNENGRIHQISYHVFNFCISYTWLLHIIPSID